MMIIDLVYELLTGPLPSIGFYSCLGLTFLLVGLPHRSRHRQQLKTITIACFWSVMLIYGLGVLALGWGEYAWLASAGVSMEASVVEVQPGYSKVYPSVTYQYAVSGADGVPRSFIRSRHVTGDVFSQARQSSTVNIRYLPTHPLISDISTNHYLLLGDRLWATVIVVIVEIGVAVLAYFSFRELWQKIYRF